MVVFWVKRSDRCKIDIYYVCMIGCAIYHQFEWHKYIAGVNTIEFFIEKIKEALFWIRIFFSRFPLDRKLNFIGAGRL
jgi:hypothetical protein